MCLLLSSYIKIHKTNVYFQNQFLESQIDIWALYVIHDDETSEPSWNESTNHHTPILWFFKFMKDIPLPIIVDNSKFSTISKTRETFGC